MRKKHTIGLIITAFIMLGSLATQVHARDLKASLALLPIHSEKGANGAPQGGFVDLVKAIDSVYNEGSITLVQAPFQRSIDNVVSGKADFHAPLICVPHVSPDSLPFSYAEEPITQVAFVLYTKADRDPLNMTTPTQYKFETLRGMKDLFPFRIREIDSIKQAMMKVQSGRIDGFIMEQEASDAYIKDNKLKNIRRTLFQEWNSCIVIPKDAKGGELDRILSNALRELKANGELQKITSKIHHPYQEWQPYETY